MRRNSRFSCRRLNPTGPVIACLYGIAGSGKTTLLEAFTRHARAEGPTVIRLDCQAIEPTQAGLLSQLAAATGGAPGSAQDVAQRLGRVGARVIVALDTYEAFRLMDTWLRQVFTPLLPDNVRFVFSGREAPVTAWYSAPGWRGLFKAIRLDSLDQQSRAGVSGPRWGAAAGSEIPGGDLSRPSAGAHARGLAPK